MHMPLEEKNRSLAYKLLSILFSTEPSKGKIENFSYRTNLFESWIWNKDLYIENSSHLNPMIYIEAHRKYKSLIDKLIEIVKKTKIGEIVIYNEREEKIFVEIFGYDQSPVLYLRLRYYQGSS